MKPNGGPAFPREDYQTNGGGVHKLGQEGMSLRDYFAARAPAEVPDWFTHAEPSKADIPPMPDYMTLDEAHRKVASDWQRDPCFDLPEELTWYGDKVKAHRNAMHDWKTENQVARFVQWRWYYADLMLVERGRL